MTSMGGLVRMTMLAWLRSRGYAATVAAGIALIVIAMLANELTGAEAFRVLTDVGLLFIGITAAAAASATTLLALTSTEDGAQLMVIATRPIPRSHLVLSRIITGYLHVAITTVLLSLVLTLASAGAGTPHPMRVLPAGLMTMCEGFAVVSIAAALGAGSSRAVASTLTIATWLLLRIGPAMVDLRSTAAVGRFLPRLDRFALGEWVHGGEVPADLAYWAAVIATMCAFLVGVAVWRFTERDLG